MKLASFSLAITNVVIEQASMSLILSIGVERNRKQRNPVNSITS